MPSIRSEYHPRGARHRVEAKVEVIEVASETRVLAHATNLIMSGCFVETGYFFPEGSKVRLRISRGSTSFVAGGRVAHSEPNGMGIAFITIEPGDMVALESLIMEPER